MKFRWDTHTARRSQRVSAFLYLASGQDRFLDVGTGRWILISVTQCLIWKTVCRGRLRPLREGLCIRIGAMALPESARRFSGTTTFQARKYSELPEKSSLRPIANTLFSPAINWVSQAWESSCLICTNSRMTSLCGRCLSDRHRCIFVPYRTKEGLAFPGDSLNEISCDLMTGSAGVGHFFHRLVNKTSAMIQVDQLFNGVGKRPLKKQGKLVRWTSIASWHCRRPLS